MQITETVRLLRDCLLLFVVMEECTVNDLLCSCVERTGYDIKTVKTIIDCFLNAIAEKDVARSEAILAGDLGAFC